METTPTAGHEEKPPPPRNNSEPNETEPTQFISPKTTESEPRGMDETIPDPDDPQHSGKKRVHTSDSDSDPQI